ncbi:SUMF1/EgtB/PvdO family nonheme iron enzyme [uncultured Desulfosarcina sp.]|uniref:formylglycine-generating enzyme family protein n=1 Tax=uncultured Desulfosarcina sp. TaxID=218289 RepID=UPI0029C6D277|nr:SUMF1/EgtB/PvdO family nonheme iron enzyme [uncultured Desulfosarcina sp.]
MKPKEISRRLNRLQELAQSGEAVEACLLAREIFIELLKSIYSQVRGQASPAMMRELLEREIEIGGENGDFRQFDSQKMIDLFAREDLVGKAEKLSLLKFDLSRIVNLGAFSNWLENMATPSSASLCFIHAWLRLFAAEAEIVDPDLETGIVGHTPSSILMEQTTEDRLPGVKPGKPYTDPITDMTFVWVPEGTFSMGDSFDEGADDEKPVHEVTLSPFAIATTPVTQAQWQRLMDENPSSCIGENHPVEQVSLANVMAFIDRLNVQSPTGYHFDLPSEAQWEYAARSGGKNERYAGGQELETVGWFADNITTGSTAPVGQKSPNALGIYDMSGNVWEWCRDFYLSDAYRSHSKNDPMVSQGGRDHVIRGGSWHLDAWSARCARRFRFDPELFGPALGFRVVMEVKRTKEEG